MMQDRTESLKRAAALPELTNRLFGRDPDGLTMPFCACSPTVSCSTVVIAWVLRRRPEASPSEVASALAKAWAAYVAGKGEAVVNIAGLEIRLREYKAKGTVWSHPPVHADTYIKAHETARERARSNDREKRAEGRKAPRPRAERKRNMSENAKETRESVDNWPHLRFPNAYVHPYEHTDKQGKTWQKAICAIPSGTKVNGVDVSGYSVDMFMRDFHVQDKALGKPVVFRMDPDRPIELFKKGEAKTLKVMPWDLTRGLAASRKAFEREHGIERDKARENPPLDERLDERPSDERYSAGAELDEPIR